MTNNKQQTAVEWLSEKVLHREWELLTQEKKRKILEQAKEMQKEQAIKLHYEYELYVMMNESDVMTFGQFYKQTYGDESKQ
jgi:TorA maturation chaperone TorD